MQLMPNIHFNVDDVIFEEGHPADSIYLLCSGRVEVLKKQGESLISLANLGEGGIFGEMALISDAPRNASIVAREDTWCYFMKRDSFIERLRQTDQKIIDVFEKLVATVNDKNRKDIVVSGSENYDDEQLDELLSINSNYGSVQSSNDAKNSILNDRKIMKKVDGMDIFMRSVFKSLIHVAYGG